MKTRRDVAVEKFLENYNCAQAVLFAFSDELHLDRNTALKIACGFGAGMGRKEEVCGAVTGGIMVIGAKYGRGEKEDRTVTDLTYAKTRELMDGFAATQGSFICRTLLNNCELTTEEGQKYFKDNDLLHKTCAHCVGSVVDILEGIMK